MESRSAIASWIAALAALIVAGCTLGPRQIDASRLRYNEAIQRTFQQELLLNLVRLRYRESPKFLVVGGVAAQYSWNGNAVAGADLISGGTDLLRLDGVIGREERPTIAYTPLETPEFSRGLLAPISIESLALLTRTGWSWDRILRITVQNVNQVENATSAGGPTPRQKPDFEQFRYLTQLLRQLQLRRAVELTQAQRTERQPLPIALDDVDGGFLLNALEQGYKFEQQTDGSWSMYRKIPYAAIVFSPEVVNSPEQSELVNALALEPGLNAYEVQLAVQGQIQPAIESG